MTIHILNPNSSITVTDGIDRAVDPMRAASPVPIRVHRLEVGPPGIETQAHVDGVVAPLLAQAATLQDTSALVVACFSDPGLAALREASRVPVLGIAESAVLTAMTMGQRFGIVAILGRSVPRHLRMLGAMGVTQRLAADLPLDLGVADLADPARSWDRLVAVGRALAAQGAETVILGCAGMAHYRTALEAELGRPVIDPCQAACAMAIGRVALERTKG
jgi:allantoin racemase